MILAGTPGADGLSRCPGKRFVTFDAPCSPETLPLTRHGGKRIFFARPIAFLRELDVFHSEADRGLLLDRDPRQLRRCRGALELGAVDDIQTGTRTGGISRPAPARPGGAACAPNACGRKSGDACGGDVEPSDAI